MAKKDVRQSILDAGLEVMHAKGYNGCSVQDITEAAEVPKGSFYSHFKSKEALAVEVLAAYRPHGDLMALEDRSIPPRERLRLYFTNAARPFSETDFQRGCLIGNFSAELADASDEVRRALCARFDRWQEAIEAVVREGQAIGDIHAGLDARRVARFLVSSWEGTLLKMKVSKSLQPVEDFMEFVLLPLQPAHEASTTVRRGRRP